jgi:aminomethyltransferase
MTAMEAQTHQELDAVGAAYRAAQEAALVVRHSAPGVLHLTGATTLDFLHRMSTNDLLDLPASGVRGTVLTTAIGRTVDVVLAFRRADDVLLLTSPGRPEAVRAWLGRYIFFNDDVALTGSPDAWSLWSVYGPHAQAEVARLAEPQGASPTSFSQIEDALVWGTVEPRTGYRVLAGPRSTARAAALWDPSASSSATRLADEVLRIERGLPAYGAEFDEDVIPLEVGLWDLVSFKKGCYIGQEIIARMESRGRVARRLVGLRLERLVEPPHDVVLGGEPIGRLTSAISSPHFGPIGLALVRTAALEDVPGRVTLAPSGAAAAVVALPFEDTLLDRAAAPSEAKGRRV